MICTINTDASFNYEFKKGSYAFWITTNNGRYKLSGVLRKKVIRPEIAEFMCIINAVYYTSINKEKLGFFNKIIINTDCLNVIHIINNDRKSIIRYGLNSTHFKQLNKQYKKIVYDNFKDIEIELRHVRSHISTETKKQYVNEWCDIQCKKSLKTYINNIKEGNNEKK